MSDHRAIAAVTATLERVVQSAINQAVQQAEVRVGAPSPALSEEAKPLVNIFLFRAVPNASARNGHLPARASDGSDRRRSQVALDLHYVFSFYGEADDFVPERLLGAVALALEDVPALTSEQIEAAVADNAGAIGESDLATTAGRIRIQPDAQSFDDFSKLWSVFFQVPYALSVAYVCSHVILETQERPTAPLPVARGDIFVAPMAALSIDSAGPQTGKAGPVAWGGMLHLTGQGLGRIGTDLRIDGIVRKMPDDAFQEDGIALALVDATFGGVPLRTGVHVVQALAATQGPALADRLRLGSNTVPFVLHPSIVIPANAVALADAAAALRSGTLKLDFSPPVQAGQVVTVMLDGRDPMARHTAVLDHETVPAANYPVTRLTFPFKDLPRTQYLVRADVDGFPTLVETGTDPAAAEFGQIVGPLVDLS
jgi:hypothetical protein